MYSLGPSNRPQSDHRRAISLQSNPPHTHTHAHTHTHSRQPSRHLHRHPIPGEMTTPRESTGGENKHRSSKRSTRRSTRVQPDLIDRLDGVNGLYYHHEGPYDAACRERNISTKRGPVHALKMSNEEALKATPHDKIMDSILGHRPLDGVAFFPPGSTDADGRKYNYEEGSNMMVEDRGNFKRWPGMKFRDEDFKNDPFYQQQKQDERQRAARKQQEQQYRRRSWGIGRRKE